MDNKVHMLKRPSCIPAGEALLRLEAWQSGLLHRDYTPAVVWVSNPLITSREFEPHRFRQSISGTVAVAPATAPINHPGDEPEANDHLDYIRLARLHFQSRSGSPLHLKDELHERTFPRPANSDNCRPH